ncbi:MAG: PHP domain-containing protein, partial [Candidatus Puniceispirillaceae bacterium]
MHAPFVHLRLHSAYSLAESTLRIKQLAALVSGDRQPAAAITDTNNMFGALEFSQAMVAAGVQPIIGTQMTLSDAAGSGEVVLLAMNETGYTNLCRLQSQALLEADATSEPSASMDMLAANADGLLVLSGGAMAGFVAAPVADGRLALARKRLESLVALCSGRVYVELQRHGLPEEDRAEAGLLELAVELQLPLVATNDCRYDTP